MILDIIILSLAIISLIIIYISVLKKSEGFVIAGFYGLIRSVLAYIPNSKVELTMHLLILFFIFIFAKPLSRYANRLIEYYHKGE